MEIPVLIEPAFQRSYWCRQTINGLFAETRQKKYELSYLNGAAYPALPYDRLFPHEPRLMVVVGTSPSWMQQVLLTLEHHRIHGVLVNYDLAAPSVRHSVVRMDYVNAMQRLISYFHSHGRRRTALLGVNPDSSSDRIKSRCFTSMLKGMNSGDPVRHIYENPQNIKLSLHRFLHEIGEYDSVICANDLVAVALLSALSQTDVRVPEDLFAAGFGESVLAQRCRPSLTTVALDHEEMGRQAVRLFAYLYRQPTRLSASIRVESRLVIGQSTQSLPEGPVLYPLSPADDTRRVDFYNDAEIQRWLAMERFYAGLDKIDAQILDLLVKGFPQEAIAEICRVSPSTVGYRVRSMQASAGASTRQELIDRMVNSLDFRRGDR